MIVPVAVIVLSYLQKNPAFNRRDVPNFLEKPVQLINLKTKSWNNTFGLVIEWNEEREQFGVQLMCDASVKWVKPMNLMYYPIPENEKETQLYTLIYAQELTDFEQGLLRFEEIEWEENYAHTYMKLFWINSVILSLAMKDKRYSPKMQKVLENIIQISTFDDLIVKAKILFFACLMGQNSASQNNPHQLQSYMRCVKDHHGYLPELFYCIFGHTDLVSELENRNIEMFKILKDIYIKSKNIIVNKLCAYGYHDDCNFLQGALEFLQFCKSHVSFPVFENISEEATILREILKQQILDRDAENCRVRRSHIVANLCMLEENYEDALINIERYHEYISTSFGNNRLGSMANIYCIKTTCYIKLGNKPMAKKALTKLNRLKHNFETINDFIGNALEDIRKMTKQNSNVAREEMKNVRPRMQCSSYICKKVEPKVGAFEQCGKCLMGYYYCSRKCSRHHWLNGHKKECKKFLK